MFFFPLKVFPAASFSSQYFEIFNLTDLISSPGWEFVTRISNKKVIRLSPFVFLFVKAKCLSLSFLRNVFLLVFRYANNFSA